MATGYSILCKKKHCGTEYEQETPVEQQAEQTDRFQHTKRRCKKDAETSAVVQANKPRLKEDGCRASG